MYIYMHVYPNVLPIETCSEFDCALRTFGFLYVGYFLKMCSLLHAKTSLSLNYNSFLDTFTKGPILFAVAAKMIQRFRRSRSRPL